MIKFSSGKYISFHSILFISLPFVSISFELSSHLFFFSSWYSGQLAERRKISFRMQMKALDHGQGHKWQINSTLIRLINESYGGVGWNAFILNIPLHLLSVS